LAINCVLAVSKLEFSGVSFECRDFLSSVE
jgi:hypothetical protein